MRDPTIKPIHGRTRWRRFWIILAPAFGVMALMMYMVASGAFALNLQLSGMPMVLTASSLQGSDFVQYALPDAVSNPAAGALVTGEEAKLHATPVNGVALATPPGSAGQLGCVNVPPNVTTPCTQGPYLADTYTLLKGATITTLHQTVCAPTPAVFGFSIPDLQVTIDATTATTGAGNPLVVQAPALTASSAVFGNIIIGQDAGQAISGYGYSGLPAYGSGIAGFTHGSVGSGLGGIFSQAADTVTINNLAQIAVGTEAGSFTLNGLSLSASFTSSCP